MSQFAIACYRPKLGKEQQLLELVRDHLPTLRAAELVTERPSYIMRAKDGTVIEVFEWKSVEAKDRAHQSAAVGRIWQQMSECADFPPLSDLEEAHVPFPNFEPVLL